MDKCPVCGENLIHANVGDGSIDTYCEECGWPDEEIDVCDDVVNECSESLE